MPRRRSLSLSDSSPAHSSDSDLSSLFSSSDDEHRPSSSSKSQGKSKKKGVVYRSLPSGGSRGGGQQERYEPDDAPVKTGAPSTTTGAGVPPHPLFGQPQPQRGLSLPTKLVIAAVVVLALCAAGGAAWYFREDLFGGSSSTSSEGTDAESAEASSGSKTSGSSSSTAKSSLAMPNGTAETTSLAATGASGTTTGSAGGSGTATVTGAQSTSTASSSSGGGGVSSTNTYTLSAECAGSSFFSCFTFNADKGLSGSDAESAGLISVEDEKAYLRLNSWEDSEDGQRPAVQMEMGGNKFRYGLTIVDVGKIPFGIFSFGSDWPAGGGIDTLEGVSLQQQSTPTIVASDSGCKIGDEGSMTGTPLEGHTDCADSSTEKPDGYSGCSVQNADEASYGEGWNKAGGGVVATLVDESGIYIWQFPRASVSEELLGDPESPDPSTWGKPLAAWPVESCAGEYFGEQTLAISTRPEAVWKDGCSDVAASCAEYAKKGKNLENMVWEFNYLRLYDVKAGSSSSGDDEGEEEEGTTTIQTDTRLATAAAGATGGQQGQTTAVAGGR
ncbi:hypothetical protein JCM6882_004850 [Rhodosporidiobolus microsporus]